MSGITPILDTLLHQVLGRRDAPVDRPLPDTLIAPPRAGLPPQSAHSDSRLDPRPLPTARTTIGAGNKVDARIAARAATAPAADPSPAIATRFSAAARMIADILARFPDAPSVLRAPAPLVIATERTNVAQLAAQLRDSIESSGLFYEAHLLRWRGGMLPLARLLREPQMLWSGRSGTAPQAPLPPPPQGDAPGATSAPLANRSGVPSANVPVPGNPPSPSHAQGAASPGYGADGKPVANAPAMHAGPPATGAPSGPPLAFAGSDPSVHPALEGVLRHQLEMLAAPVLRWEGAPWAGVFMALTLQPPPRDAEQEHAGDRDRYHRHGDAPWETRLTLRLTRLGEVKVNLQFGAQRIALDFEAEPEAADRMHAGSSALRDRLGAMGFHDVALRIRARSGGGRP